MQIPRPSSPTDVTLQLLKDYIAWLQRFGGFTGEWKGARDYIAKYLRHLGANENPLDHMPPHEYRTAKQAFNKARIPTYHPNMAFPRPLAKDLYFSLTKGKQVDKVLAIALLTYMVTAVRPGNLLLGTAASALDQALKIEDVIICEHSNKSKPPVFIRNNDGKTIHKPTCRPVPYHPENEFHKCAATRLITLRNSRINSGALPSNLLFINPTNKNPITTTMANRRIRYHITKLLAEKEMDPTWAKFFTLKSARKGVASYLEHSGIKAPSISKKMGHGSINSQISYHCNLFETNPEINKNVYKGM